MYRYLLFSGKCWQEGCGSTSCDGGRCSTNSIPPAKCLSPSCIGTTCNIWKNKYFNCCIRTCLISNDKNIFLYIQFSNYFFLPIFMLSYLEIFTDFRIFQKIHIWISAVRKMTPIKMYEPDTQFSRILGTLCKKYFLCKSFCF